MRWIVLSSIILFGFSLFSQPLKVNINAFNPNETSIGISRLNPAVWVAGCNINYIFQSKDYGKTWEESIGKSSLGFYGDPVILPLRNGHFLLAHLAMNSQRANAKSIYSGMDRIVVQSSIDEGLTWSDGSSVGFNNGKMQDKPWMCEYEDGTVGISWTEFDVYNSSAPEHKSRVRFALSENNGLSFSEAVTVSDREGNCIDNDMTPEGATTAYLGNNTVVMAWSFNDTIWMDISHDLGKSWGIDIPVAIQRGGWVSDQDYFYRSNGLPFIQTDGRKHIYITYTASSGYNLSSVMLAHTADEGKSWRVTRLDTTKKGAQYMPAQYFNRSSGMGYILYYDVVPGSDVFDFQGLCHVRLARYDLEGRVRQIGTLTPVPFALPKSKTFFGDYSGIDASGGMIAPLWTQTNKKRELEIVTWPLQEGSIPAERKDTGLAIPLGVNATLWYHPQLHSNKHFVYRNGLDDPWKKVKAKKVSEGDHLYIIRKDLEGAEIGEMENGSVVKWITPVR